MKISIRDAVPSVTQARAQRLVKPAVELATVLYGIALLRISLGLLFLSHGLLKVIVFTLPETAQFFVAVGVPGFMAAPVALSEILGGLLLIGGVYSRWVALGLFPIPLVATFKVHGSNGWLFTNQGGGWEFPAFFAIACLVQFLVGDGALAIGAVLSRKRS